MADKLRATQQLEQLQARYVGTGHPDTTKYEWTANIARDTYASYVGHPELLQYMAIGLGESREKVRLMMLEKMIRPVGNPPVSAYTGSGASTSAATGPPTVDTTGNQAQPVTDDTDSEASTYRASSTEVSTPSTLKWSDLEWDTASEHEDENGEIFTNHHKVQQEDDHRSAQAPAGAAFPANKAEPVDKKQVQERFWKQIQDSIDQQVREKYAAHFHGGHQSDGSQQASETEQEQEPAQPPTPAQDNKDGAGVPIRTKMSDDA